MLGTSEEINHFRGQYSFLSNFHSCEVEYDGFWYTNAEAAFQAAKTNNIHEKLPFRNYSGSEAKKAGRRLELRHDWEKVKIQIMYDICCAKFKKNDHLRDKLLNTHPMKLVEGNTWGDTFWGCVSGEGSNFFGRILMIVRDEIIKEENEADQFTQQDLWEKDGY